MFFLEKKKQARRCPRREPHEAADGRAWRAASSVARARRRAQWHVRADWVAQRLDEWFAASPLAEATVAEIGPCDARRPLTVSIWNSVEF